jgi:predicted permease
VRLEQWRYTLPLRLRSLFRRERVERELEEELQFHLEAKIEEGVARGLAPGEARRRALLALGGLERRKEEIRAARRLDWLTDFLADVRFAGRGLRRTPGLSTLVVVTLALGIGMTATPYSMLDALVFRPYPVPDPGRIVTLNGTTRDDPYANFSYREYRELRDRTRSYAGMIANTPAAAVGFAARAGETPRIRSGMLVSANYFRALGVEPRIGRGFRDGEDELPGREAVAVLGPDFWRNEFAADPGIVGRRVRVNGTEVTVIGVAPASFPGLQVFARPDLYLPLALAPVFSTDARKSFFEDRDARELVVRARLAPGVTLAAARAELAGLARDFERAYPESNRGRGAALRTRFEIRTRGDDLNWKFGVAFLGLALSVLLVACTNVAGLLLSRARARARENAVRLAMGAGRFRLIRLLLTESLVLALLGGAGGIAVGWAGIALLRTFTIPAELPVEIPFRMDRRVLAACFAMSVASAFACGLAPALQTTRTDLVTGLKAADVDAPGRRRLWGRSALVVAQVAMSLMLLAAAFLMARSFEASAVGGIGFDQDRLLLVRFDPRLVQYDAERTARFYRQLVERVRQTSGVRATGLTQNPPLGLGSFAALAFVPEGFELPPDRESLTAMLDTVDEGFFSTLGIPLVRGRGFLAADGADAPRVAVVNEALADRYFPDGDAVGRRLRLDGPEGEPVEIVGVARTVKYRETTERPVDLVYLPLAQRPLERMVLLVRTEGEPLALAEPIQQIVRALDPDLPIAELRTYDDLYRYHVVEGPGAAIRLVGTLGGAGLVMAIAGLYGLVAYNVSRRTREIGIRMAVGARPAEILRLMMRKGLILVGLGAANGLALGFAVERAMKSALFETSGVDAVAYLVVVPSMLLVTALAAYLPARRAARIAPTTALRYE